MGLWPGMACSDHGRPLRILILGGTNYLGPAIVSRALDQGHQLTLFNRGITNPELFPDLEKLQGDRAIETENLAALEGNRKWDMVIDTWPADPRMVGRTALLLKDRTKAYAFVSSIAVYKDKTIEGITETAPLHEVAAFTPGMSYYQSKVLCEAEVREVFPDTHIIVRPPGIFGKRDESWSLVYWLWRIRAGGKVLAPGDGTDPVQWIDVRDVGNFVLLALSTGQYGIYNTIGPEKPMLFKDFLERINTHFGNPAELVWVSNTFIEQHELRPVVDIPIWEPKTRRPGRHTMSSKKALQAGMTLLPINETFESALQWYDQVKSPIADPGLDKNRPFNGITRARELELLALWENGGEP